MTSRSNQQASTPHRRNVSSSLRRKSAFGLSMTLTFELGTWISFEHVHSHDEYLCPSVNEIPPLSTEISHHT